MNKRPLGMFVAWGALLFIIAVIAETEIVHERSEWMPPYRPRWANEMYAKTHGFFWIKCPICGRYFGGHEWLDGASVPECGKTGFDLSVCPLCVKRAREITKAGGCRNWTGGKA